MLTAEHTTEETQEEAPVPAEVIWCPRCGENEVDPNASTCDNCEDWIPCARCGELHDPNDSSCVDGAQWCQNCTDNYASTCDRRGCGALTSRTHCVETGDGAEEWCEDCLESSTFHCDCCDNDFDERSIESHTHVGSTYCNGCFDLEFWYCDSCNTHHRDGDRCPNVCEHIAGYGGHGRFFRLNRRARSLMPVFGAEMEVGDYKSISDRNNAVNKFMDIEGMGHKFAYPTSDSSLGDNGVEYITHPLGTLDWIFDDRLSTFMDLQVENNADCGDRTNAGCHLTTERSVFKTDEAVKAMIALVSRFHAALLAVGDCKTRGSYCEGITEDDDPIEMAQRIGKYSAVNIEKGNLVEVRIPGMVLSRDRFVAQVQLYANAIDWANKATSYKDAGSVSFREAFLPVLHQNTILDAIEIGIQTPALKYTTPHGFLMLDTVVPLQYHGHILGVPCIVLGEQFIQDPDHDSYRSVDGTTVEVGDIIAFNNVVGVAVSPARNFQGNIFRSQGVGRTSNRILGYGFFSDRSKRKLTLRFYSDGTKPFGGSREYDIVFNDCERLPEIEADPVPENYPVTVSAGRIYSLDTFAMERLGHMRFAKDGEAGVNVVDGTIAVGGAQGLSERIMIPVKAGIGNCYRVFVDHDGDLNVHLSSGSGVIVRFPGLKPQAT